MSRLILFCICDLVVSHGYCVFPLCRVGILTHAPCNQWLMRAVLDKSPIQIYSPATFEIIVVRFSKCIFWFAEKYFGCVKPSPAWDLVFPYFRLWLAKHCDWTVHWLFKTSHLIDIRPSISTNCSVLKIKMSFPDNCSDAIYFQQF